MEGKPAMITKREAYQYGLCRGYDAALVNDLELRAEPKNFGKQIVYPEQLKEESLEDLVIAL